MILIADRNIYICRKYYIIIILVERSKRCMINNIFSLNFCTYSFVYVVLSVYYDSTIAAIVTALFVVCSSGV